MNSKIYAGIGAKNTPKEVLYLMKIFGIILASKNYVLNTGAAKGADQAFAEGARLAEGKVNLFIPWVYYQALWIKKLTAKKLPMSKNTVTTLVLDENRDIAALESVKELHPAFEKLKPKIIALHARNYLILEHAKFAICYTKDGKVCGGTGQAIRIMENMKKKVFNLGNKHTISELCETLYVNQYVEVLNSVYKP